MHFVRLRLVMAVCVCTCSLWWCMGVYVHRVYSYISCILTKVGILRRQNGPQVWVLPYLCLVTVAVGHNYNLKNWFDLVLGETVKVECVNLVGGKTSMEGG